MMAKLFNPYLLLIVLGLCCSYVMAQGIIFPGEISTRNCKTPDGEIGKCLNIFKCATIKEYIGKVRNTIKNTELIKNITPYMCRRRGSYPDVCCTSTPIPVKQTEDKIKLLPMNDCGTTPDINRIVNGKKASLYEFPWMAALMYESPNGPEPKCGGALINKRYVLTAAHCLTQPKSKSQKILVNVRLGEVNFESDIDCDVTPYGESCAPAPQNFEVSLEDAVIHPKFNPLTLTDDIALIRLRKDADVTNFSVKPVCLPANEITNKTSFKKKLTTSGWGLTENDTTSPHLLKVIVPVIENDECSNFYTGPILISKDQLCAGGENSENTCDGDSGGPLMQLMGINGVLRAVQYGIVSAGPLLCQRENFPVRYTRVTSYIDWILDNIKS